MSLLCVAGTAAFADTISISVSATAAGSLAGQQFRGTQVTWTAETTTQEVAACAAGTATDGCTYFQNDFQREYRIPFSTGTVTVGDLGTFSLIGPEWIDFFAGVYDLEQIRLINSAGGLSFGLDMPNFPFSYNLDQSVAWQSAPEGSFRDDNCDQGPPEQCAVFASTTGGELRLTSARQPVAGQIMVGGNDLLAPEPGTWVMVGTGLLGGMGAVRRRFGRRE